MLEERVSALEAETARQKETIKAHEATIATQVAAIAGLESEISSAKAQISDLSSTLAQRDETIAQQTATIESLNSNVAQLNADLASEKQSHSRDVEAAQQAAKAKEEELTKQFDGERSYLENKHKKELEKLENEHKAAMDKLDKQKESEKAKIRKDADSRVKAAQKEADKKAKAEIKAETDKAKAEAKKAAKKASDTAAMYKKELKIDRGNDGLFKYDFPTGALGVQGLKAVSLASSGADMGMLPQSSKIAVLFIVKDNKKVTLYNGRHNKLEVVKNFRGTTEFDVCKDLIKEEISKSNGDCAYITYKSVDKNYVSNLAKFLKSEANVNVTQTYHNKSQKSGKSILGIYFYRG